MSSEPQDAVVPGEVLRKKLGERGWTQEDMARILGRPLPTVNTIIRGKKGITPEMAVALGTAFETGAAFWLELEANYRLSLVGGKASDVQRRAHLYGMAPIKGMEKRQWIRRTSSLQELEGELRRFFGADQLDDPPPLTFALRASGSATKLSSAQRAWCFRAVQLAKTQQVRPFAHERLPEARAQLRQLAAYPEETRKVPRVLAEYGIRFVVVEPLPGSKIDGATFWIDENSPTIALSVRYDRIDAFWFTLAHEFSHVARRDSISVDADLVGAAQMPSAVKPDAERRADEQGAAMLIDPSRLQSFIVRVGPMYSKSRIIQFANRMQIHPGIVVGQLQYRGEIGYSANREMLVKVRGIVTPSSITDGWGQLVSL